jgi:hypothetical protein
MESVLTFHLLWLLFYFIPTLIARYRGHNNIVAIFICNLFGFTVVLWFAALIWACTSNTAAHKAAELEQMRRALQR